MTLADSAVNLTGAECWNAELGSQCGIEPVGAGLFCSSTELQHTGLAAIAADEASVFAFDQNGSGEVFYGSRLAPTILPYLKGSINARGVSSISMGVDEGETSVVGHGGLFM